LKSTITEPPAGAALTRLKFPNEFFLTPMMRAKS